VVSILGVKSKVMPALTGAARVMARREAIANFILKIPM
jgi:hypothetical protein